MGMEFQFEQHRLGLWDLSWDLKKTISWKMGLGPPPPPSPFTTLNFDMSTLVRACDCNRPRSIYQYSNMAPRLSGQTSIFGVVFFVFKSLLGIEGQRKLEKFAILVRKLRSHARILIYQTWPIARNIQ